MQAQSKAVTVTHSIVFTGKAESSQHVCNNGYLIVLRILAGELRVETEEVFELAADDILVIPTYTDLQLRNKTDCRYLQFIFDSPRFFDEIGIPPLFRITPCIKGDSTLCGICDAIGEEYEKQEAFHETMLSALVKQLLIRMYRMYPDTQDTASNDLGKQRVVRSALSYIYENCQNGISTRDMAEHASVSVSYLCRCFKEIFGITPLDYSERIRCRKAHEDLSLGIYSVGEVASKYRFSGLSYFNRRYRKYIGENPSETRREAIRRHEK